ncbi:MMPL family transporter [Sporichthya sp.]|uniref:MMPL family transporter n=1 Tax=Sporichthya sp. TaxID=65475 RepID=UPI0017E77E35|nr:MMPL family transporter [Sporichthya sp.]MBA3742711.1 MMPL family transporter [Sporichthya sp.]
MERIADFVLRHRRAVILFWFFAFVAGAGATGTTVDRLTADFSVPGQPGFDTSKAINKALGEDTDNGPSIPVITVPEGQTVDDRRDDIEAIWNKVREEHPEWRVADWITTNNDNLVTKDRRATYAVVYGPPADSFDDKPFGIEIADEYGAEQAEDAEVLKVIGTGYFELAVSDAEGGGEEGGGPGVLFEVLFGALGALLVLTFVFASFLALLPILIAAVSIVATFGALLPFTYAMDMNIVLQFLVALIGLGVAIDYSLLVVTRWREERDHGRDNHDAVKTAVEQAGHSVVFSGAAVAIGLLSLTFLNVPFLRSMGVGGILIPLISTLATITLTPAILAAVGPRIDRPRIRKEATASRFWSRWSNGVVKRPWLALGAALVMLGLLAAPVFGIKLGNAETSSLTTKEGPIVTQYQELVDGGVPRGVLTPIEVFTTGDTNPVIEALKGVDGVAFAFTSVPESGFAKGSNSVIEVIPTNETVNSDSNKVVGQVRDAVEDIPGVVGVTGMGAVLEDYNKGIYAKVPLLLVILSVLTFIALTRAFRSVVLAAKAVVLNLISLAATFGVMVWVWQDGHGSETLFDVQSTGSIIFWTPIMIFAFLYGLSMDYEVFILTRVREEYDRTGETNAALIEGLGRTGRLVTSAALILFLAFVSLAASPGTDIKVLATGLGVGILLDATIVRMLLVPALVVLFGRWNWYLPAGLAKVLRVEPSPLLPPKPASVPEPARV